MADFAFPPEQVAPRLIAWYRQQGRELPWRQTRDPYRIWLSEIMLQQTTVTAVIGYYQRFLENFPTVERLAAASPEAVIDLWAGLGYYARARNLHAAAKLVVEEFAGNFPRSVEELQRLPGVGRSTAGAIAALAFAERAPILDGNVRRVLCRLFALQQPPRSSSAERQLWAWAEQLTPPQAQVHDYTQAIMDLGAIVCVPRKPLCGECPLAGLCRARLLGLEQQLPLRQQRQPVPTRQEVALLLDQQGHYPVRRRPASGLLGGLWEFPTISVAADESVEQKLRMLLSSFAVGGMPQSLGSIQHIYSHFRLELQLFRLNISAQFSVAENDYRWYPREELQRLALHGAHKKALDKLIAAGV